MELASEREKARRDVEELGKKVQVNTLDYVLALKEYAL